MLTSNLSHCLRYGTQAKSYDMMEFCQPRTLLTWVCPRIVIDQGIWRCEKSANKPMYRILTWVCLKIGYLQIQQMMAMFPMSK